MDSSDIPPYVHLLTINKVPAAKSYIVVSAIDLPDQIFDPFDWKQEFQTERILIVDEHVSPGNPTAYFEAAFTGLKFSSLLKTVEVDFSLITTVELYSNLHADSESPMRIPIQFLNDDSVGAIIVVEMNGRQLDIRSGGPFFLVIPGYLSTSEFYSISSVNLTNSAFKLPLEIPLMTFVTEPKNETIVKNREELKVKGNAFAGGGKHLLFVEYSIDKGVNWIKCYFEEDKSVRKALKSFRLNTFLFTLELREIPKNAELLIRATDQNWVTQPESIKTGSECPYDNSYFRVIFKDMPNNQRCVIFPGTNVELVTDFKLIEDKTIQAGGPLRDCKKDLKEHFVENVLPIKSKGLRNTNGLSEAVSRTVGGYKKRDLSLDTRGELGCQANAKKDLRKREPWRKLLERHVEIDLRKVDEQKLRPFHSQWIPALEKPGAKQSVKTYSREEVRQHNTPEDCWVIIREHVYDLTPLVKSHPIGSELFAVYAGTECSYAFEATHEPQMMMMLDQYYVGKLQTFVNKALVSNLVIPSWTTLTLTNKKQLTHDVYEFVFRNKSALLRVPLASHFYLTIYDKDGSKVIRPYNLIRMGEDKRDFIFAIKIYQKSSVNPEGGKFTQLLDKLKKGDMIKCYGPVSHLDHLGKSYVEVKGQRLQFFRFIIVVGGTGLTPMMSMLQTFLPLGSEVCLVCCNKTEDDILYRTQLNEYAKQYPNMSLHHVVEWVSVTAQYRWNQFTGMLNEVHLKKVIKGGPRKSDALLVCGRWKWVLEVRKMLMTSFGYDRRQFINF